MRIEEENIATMATLFKLCGSIVSRKIRSMDTHSPEYGPLEGVFDAIEDAEYRLREYLKLLDTQ